MMQDKIIIKAPAKINLFLHILNKREDGYHNIKSGITFINLFDEVCIKKNNSMIIEYSGTFKSDQDFFEDCIIKKTLKFLNLDNKINLKINIKKNNLSKAATMMENVIEIAPGEAISLDHLGDIYFTLGRKREAYFMWIQALDLAEPEDHISESVQLKIDKYNAG